MLFRSVVRVDAAGGTAGGRASGSVVGVDAPGRVVGGRASGSVVRVDAAGGAEGGGRVRMHRLTAGEVGWMSRMPA